MDLLKITIVLSQFMKMFFSEQINWNALTHKLKLSEMYIKAGRLDDSWKLLNALINEYPDELARIRGCQFKQLKKREEIPRST